MKQLRLFLLLAAGLFLTSCSEPQSDEFPNPDPPPTVGRHAVPIDQALGELDDLLGVIDGQGTRAGGVRSVAQVQTLHAQALPLTRSAGEPGEQPENLLYVVNFEDDAGYAVLGADDRLPAVLAVTDEGSLTTEELVRAANGQTAPEEFTFPNEMLMNYVSGIGGIGGIGGGGIGGGGIGGGGGIPTGPITDLGWQQGPVDITFTGNTVDEWKPVEYTPPMTRTKWGQNAPFNAYCPAINGQKCVTGCTAVAAAQLFCSNKIIRDAAPEVIGDYRIRWDLIQKTINDPKLLNESNNPTQEALAVAYLIRACGRGLGMNIGDYGLQNSSCNYTKIKGFISDYGYMGADKHTFRFKYVRTMLWDRKKAVIVRGDGKKLLENGKAHHAWLADGWLYRTRNQYANFSDGSKRKIGTQEQTLMHCNFGWKGTADGYYAIGMFNTLSGRVDREPADGENHGGSLYDDNLKIFTYTEVY